MGVGSALGVTSEFAAAQAGGCARVEWLRGREDVLRGAAAAVSSASDRSAAGSRGRAWAVNLALLHGGGRRHRGRSAGPRM